MLIFRTFFELLIPQSIMPTTETEIKMCLCACVCGVCVPCFKFCQYLDFILGLHSCYIHAYDRFVFLQNSQPTLSTVSAAPPASLCLLAGQAQAFSIAAPHFNLIIANTADFRSFWKPLSSFLSVMGIQWRHNYFSTFNWKFSLSSCSLITHLREVVCAIFSFSSLSSLSLLA